MFEIQIWQFILWIVLAIIGGAVAGFFVTRYIFQKQLRDNPPVNEKMIRAMFRSMGRTATFSKNNSEKILLLVKR